MKMLKNVLLVNAVSSGATGLGLITFPGLLADLFNVPQKMPFLSVGVFLIAFATWVYFVSRTSPISIASVRMVILLDALWVVGSIGILLFQMFSLSLLGYLCIGLVAAWVGLMAFLQYRGVTLSSAN